MYSGVIVFVVVGGRFHVLEAPALGGHLSFIVIFPARHLPGRAVGEGFAVPHQSCLLLFCSSWYEHCRGAFIIS